MDVFFPGPVDAALEELVAEERLRYGRLPRFEPYIGKDGEERPGCRVKRFTAQEAQKYQLPAGAGLYLVGSEEVTWYDWQAAEQAMMEQAKESGEGPARLWEAFADLPVEPLNTEALEDFATTWGPLGRRYWEERWSFAEEIHAEKLPGLPIRGTLYALFRRKPTVGLIDFLTKDEYMAWEEEHTRRVQNALRAEPVADWVQAVKWLRDMAEWRRQEQQGQKPGGDWRLMLDYCLQDVGVSALPDRYAPNALWLKVPTLWHAVHVSFLLEVRPIRRCLHCGSLFGADDHRAKFCTFKGRDKAGNPVCRNRYNGRHWYQQKKANTLR